MKVIFLDIDGVMNSQKWYCSDLYQNIVDSDEIDNYIKSFDPEAITNLNAIIKLTGAKVVVSSSWRGNKTVEQLQTMLETSGFVGEVIGKTIKLRFESYHNSAPRGMEIKDWLDNHKNNGKLIPYVILDDDSDMMYNQRHNFVHVNEKVGLSHKDVQKSVNILNQ